MQMQLEIAGAEAGTFTNQESGDVVRWAAVYMLQPFEEGKGLGVKTERLKADASVFDALKGQKFPAKVNCEVSMRATQQGHALKVQKVIQ